MTLNPEVHWHEGMFLRPHHLQAALRHVHSGIAFGTRRSGPGRWGFSRIELSTPGIEAFEIQIDVAEAVFKDGACFSFPSGTGRVAPRNFKDAFERCRGRLPVYLAIPKRLPDRGLVDHDLARFQVEEVGTLDENNGDANSRKPIAVRQYRGHILFGDDSTQASAGWKEDASSFEVLKIADILRSDDVAARPRLDAEVVPPLLDVRAWSSLRESLEELCSILVAKNHSLADEVASREVARGFVSGKESDAFLKLHATNTFVPLLRQLCLVPEVHPFDTYLVLCQLAGHLSYFGADQRAPDLPVYDHDRLGACFRPAIETIRKLLEKTVPRDYQERRFAATDDPYMWEAEFLPEWLHPDHALYIGVTRGLTDDERMNPGPAVIDFDSMVSTQMKLFARSDRDTVFRNIIPGLGLTPVRFPAATMPHNEDESYYILDQKKTVAENKLSGPDRWEALRRGDGICIGWNSAPVPGLAVKLYAARTRY